MPECETTTAVDGGILGLCRLDDNWGKITGIAIARQKMHFAAIRTAQPGPRAGQPLERCLLGNEHEAARDRAHIAQCALRARSDCGPAQEAGAIAID